MGFDLSRETSGLLSVFALCKDKPIKSVSNNPSRFVLTISAKFEADATNEVAPIRVLGSEPFPNSEYKGLSREPSNSWLGVFLLVLQTFCRNL